MMRFFITYIVLLTLGLATGPQSIYVIQSAYLLSNSSTGIAVNHELNPANVDFSNQYISFSKNSLIYDLEGQKTAFLNSLNGKYIYFSFESLSSLSIPIYGENPSDDTPEGFFDSYWYALELAQTLNLNNYFSLNSSIQLGYKLKASLYKLFASKQTNFSIDIGLNKRINSQLSLGFVINNIGLSKNDINQNQNSGIYDGRSELGIGVHYLTPSEIVKISGDLYYRNNNFINKFSLETNFPILNLSMGTTAYDGYKDFCYGFIFDLKGWSFIYGYLSFENSNLNSQKSIQIKRKF